MNDTELKIAEPWYKDGLRFGCTQCGKCCTGSPGYVFVDDEEVKEMAKFLNITMEDFCARYLRIVESSYVALKEHSKHKNYDCVFLEDKKCKVYGARPKKCRTFPFWSEYLKSKEHWKDAQKRCEGITDEAPLIPIGEIHRQLKESES